MARPINFELRALKGGRGARREPPHPPPLLEMPEPPPFLRPAAVDAWYETGKTLIARRVICAGDLSAFSAYCCAVGLLVEATEQLAKEGFLIEGAGNTKQRNPLCGIVAQARRDVLQFGSHFGLSPSTRTRVRPLGDPAHAGDKLDNLLA